MGQKTKTAWMARVCGAIILCGITTIALRAQNSHEPFGGIEATGANLGPNLIINGAFGMGNTGFVSDYADGNVYGPGTYVIGPSPCKAPGHWSDWECFPPHNGHLMFIANGGNSESETVWSETLNVAPGASYIVSFWAATLNTSIGSPAQLLLQINGRVLAQIVLPDQSPVSGGSWVSLNVYWASAESSTATVVILDANTSTSENDFVVDDVNFRQLL